MQDELSNEEKVEGGPYFLESDENSSTHFISWKSLIKAPRSHRWDGDNFKCYAPSENSNIRSHVRVIDLSRLGAWEPHTHVEKYSHACEHFTAWEKFSTPTTRLDVATTCATAVPTTTFTGGSLAAIRFRFAEERTVAAGPFGKTHSSASRRWLPIQNQDRAQKPREPIQTSARVSLVLCDFIVIFFSKWCRDQDIRELWRLATAQKSSPEGYYGVVFRWGKFKQSRLNWCYQNFNNKNKVYMFLSQKEFSWFNASF